MRAHGLLLMTLKIVMQASCMQVPGSHCSVTNASDSKVLNEKCQNDTKVHT